MQQSQQQNSFNLENYQNQVAKAIQDNQNKMNPGFLGNFISGISPLGHDIYSSAGYNVPGMGIQESAWKAASLFTGGGLGGGSSSGLGQIPGFGGPVDNPTLSRSTGNSYIPGMFAKDEMKGISTDPRTGLMSYSRY